MKKLLALVPAALLATTALAAAADFTISVAHEAPGEENHLNRAALYFQQEMAKRTDGRVEVVLYPGGQMGTDRELIELTQEGTLDISIPTVSKLAPWDTAFAAPELPYVFPNRDVALKVLGGEFGEFLNARLEPMGLKTVGWFENGFRHATNNTRPIHKPEDFQGIKLRTMQVDAHIAAFQHMGANPTPMAFSELYSALQQKVVDGQENPLTNIAMNRMYEVQKYVSLTNHVYSAYIVLMNPDNYAALPEDIQSTVTATLQDALKYQIDIIESEEAEYLETIKAAGTAVNELTAEEMAAFQASVAEIEGELSEMVGKDAYDALLTAVKNAS
ncbi:TRAP transporter substrate-binding protein [Pseudovibrio flavus]|uniref:TRAP transporter substrate-binding protein n=1 Tax=Pseudovibrio flavus TaxID=2529854 RepID=UPI00211BB672|nr:TRAP transporter substrate-binding protein [Pseudovibrio flavus]